MLRKYLLIFVSLCTFIKYLMVPYNIHAQEDNSELTKISLEELLNLRVVTSNKKEESLLKSPAYVNIITSDEIRDLNLNTIDEILEYSVGISTLTAEGNKFPTTTIRGNTSPIYNVNTLLLFDGLPVYNPYHGSFNLSTIPLSAIDRIEIVKGSNSVIYGTNAINAVINIIPKQRSKDGISVEGRTKFGSYNTITLNNAFLYQRKNINASIYSDLYNTNGEHLKYFDQETGKPFDFRKNLTFGNLASIIKWKGLKLHGQYSNIRTPALENSQPYKVYHTAGIDTFYTKSSEIVTETQILTGIVYERAINKGLFVTGEISYQDWSINADTPDLKKNYLSSAIRTMFEIKFQPFRHSLGSVGLEFNNYLASRTREGIRNNRMVKFRDVNPNLDEYDDYAIYVNAESSLGEKANLYYGGRFYSSTYDNNRFENFSPRLSITYDLKKDIVIKAAYGQSFRVPATFERSSTSDTAHGNPFLKPETSSSYDLVFSYQGKMSHLDLNIFHMSIRDKILRIDACDKDRIMIGDPKIVRIFNNVNSFDFYGMEVNAKWSISNIFSGLFGYSLVHTVNKDDDKNRLGDDPWYYRHMINLAYSYQIASIVSMTGSSKYMSDFGFGEGYTVAPSYTVFNMGVNIHPIRTEDIRLEFKVDNMTNVNIRRPEISNRMISTAPTVPYEFGRRFSIGISYIL